MTDLPAIIHPNLVAAHARAWIGTPHHRRGTIRGRGADCAGMISGIFYELTGVFHELPAYRADWSLAGDPILFRLAREMVHVPAAASSTGLVGAFRLGAQRHAHVGVVDGADLIHAADYAGAVVRDTWASEHPMSSAWGIPLPQGCETGVVSPDLSNVVAVLEPSACAAFPDLPSYRARIYDDRGRELARTNHWDTVDEALAALDPIYPHIERID